MWKTNFFGLLRFIHCILEQWDVDYAFNKIGKNYLNINKKRGEWRLKFEIVPKSKWILDLSKWEKKSYWIIVHDKLTFDISFSEIDSEIILKKFRVTTSYRYEIRSWNPEKKIIASPKWKLQKQVILDADGYVSHFPFILNLFWRSNNQDFNEKFKGDQLKEITNDNITSNKENNKNFQEWFLRSVKPILRNSDIKFVNINPIEARKPVLAGENWMDDNNLSENWNNLSVFLKKKFIDKPFKNLFIDIIKSDLPFISDIWTEHDPKTGYNFIRIKENETDISSAWISDGTIDYIAYISLLLSAKDNMWIILCIEEIERNLHFRLLDSLISRFRNELGESNIQLFITTHSMSMLNSLTKNEVYLIRRVEWKSVITPINKIQNITSKLEIESLWNLFFDNEIDYD